MVIYEEMEKKPNSKDQARMLRLWNVYTCRSSPPVSCGVTATGNGMVPDDAFTHGLVDAAQMVDSVTL